MPRSRFAKLMEKRGLPVIAPHAITNYINRPLRNYDFLKEAPAAELHDYIRRDLGYRFPTDPWHNQLVCFAIAAQRPDFLFFMKMGGGKSSVTLNQIRHRKRLGHLQRALVLAPELIHLNSWEQQLREHAPDLKYRILIGSKEEREQQLRRDADVFFLNYSGLQPFMTERMQVQRNKRKVNKQLIHPDIAGAFAAQFNFVAFDELHRVTNNKSLYYDLFRWLCIAAKFRYVLDGTPWDGKDPEPLFHYFKLIDRGATFGPSVEMFRHAFFTPKKDYWSGISWKFDKARAPSINRMIKNSSISYQITELHDMPPKVVIKVPVRLGPEAAQYYKRSIDGIKEARGDYHSIEGLYTRMRQCTSGFLSLKADDASRIQVQFKENAKLDALVQLLKVKEGEKVMVFHEFTISGDIIVRALEAAHIPHTYLRGGMGAQGAINFKKFIHAPLRECRVLVVNNRLGSENLNPQEVCRRIVFFESPDNPKQREQAEGRPWRPGQKFPVFIHDLMALQTVDEKILRSNAEGEGLMNAVLSGRISLEEEVA